MVLYNVGIGKGGRGKHFIMAKRFRLDCVKYLTKR